MYVFFWYCFDDWLATVTNTPWVGNVPWFAVLCIGLMTCIFHRATFVKNID